MLVAGGAVVTGGGIWRGATPVGCGRAKVALVARVRARRMKYISCRMSERYPARNVYLYPTKYLKDAEGC